MKKEGKAKHASCISKADKEIYGKEKAILSGFTSIDIFQITS